jgi:hypothetical protein
LLDLQGAFHSAEHAGKLGQDPVARGINDPNTVIADHGRHDRLVRLEIADRALFAEPMNAL